MNIIKDNMELLQELIIFIISFLDHCDKINLFLTSKKYNFILDYIFEVPLGCHNIEHFKNLKTLNLCFDTIITDKSLSLLTNLTSLDLFRNKIITDNSLSR